MKRVGFVSILMLVLLVFTFSDSSAQADIGFKGVGARLGYVDADFINGTILFGGHADLGSIIENLVIMPSIDYFSKNSVKFLSINANVRYYFPTSGDIDFFAGGGLAFVRVDLPDVTVTVPGLPTITSGGSSTGLGLNLKGGAEMPISDNMKGTAELIYVTEGSQIKIMGGVTFMMGN